MVKYVTCSTWSGPDHDLCLPHSCQEGDDREEWNSEYLTGSCGVFLGQQLNSENRDSKSAGAASNPSNCVVDDASTSSRLDKLEKRLQAVNKTIEVLSNQIIGYSHQLRSNQGSRRSSHLPKRSAGVCYKCGDPDHWADRCPNRASGNDATPGHT